MFVDADTTGYVDCLRSWLPRSVPAGVLLVDHLPWSGRVVDPGITDDDIATLRRFHDMVAGDVRVEAVVLTTFDGLTMARKLLRTAGAG